MLYRQINRVSLSYPIRMAFSPLLLFLLSCVLTVHRLFYSSHGCYSYNGLRHYTPLAGLFLYIPTLGKSRAFYFHSSTLYVLAKQAPISLPSSFYAITVLTSPTTATTSTSLLFLVHLLYTGASFTIPYVTSHLLWYHLSLSLGIPCSSAHHYIYASPLCVSTTPRAIHDVLVYPTNTSHHFYTPAHCIHTHHQRSDSLHLVHHACRNIPLAPFSILSTTIYTALPSSLLIHQSHHTFSLSQIPRI
jgi:hypothetical protein